MNRRGLRQSSSLLPIWKLIFMHQFNQSRCQSGMNGEKSSKADFVSINIWMWFAVWHWQWKMWNSFSTHVGERAKAPRFCLMSFIIELLHITHDDILDWIDYVGSFLCVRVEKSVMWWLWSRRDKSTWTFRRCRSFFSPITQSNQNNHISDSPSINDNEFYPLSASSFFHYRG